MNKIRKYLRSIKKLPKTLDVYRSKPAAKYPFDITIECSGTCNLRCKHCIFSEYMKRGKGIIKFEDFKKLFDKLDLKSIELINFAGYGEPLINPEIAKIVRYVGTRNKKINKYLVTNAVLLNKEMSRKLILVGLDEIYISFDGATKKTYEKIRRGSRFELVLENIKDLIKLKKEMSSRKPKIIIYFTLMKDNISELAKMTELVDRLGIEIQILPLVIRRDKEDMDISLKGMSKENIRKHINEAIKKAKKLKNKKILAELEKIKKTGGMTEASGTWDNAPCYSPWTTCFITWDGEILPCCHFWDGQISYGNLFNGNFNELWNSKTARNFRKNCVKGKRNTLCARCGNQNSESYKKFCMITKILPVLKNFSDRSYK
ncbi:radical SAM protein [Candidatus Pacearchaeota archaeon]|nr:radical SAM protein [Candidatus Pacearchaeota archaeon]